MVYATSYEDYENYEEYGGYADDARYGDPDDLDAMPVAEPIREPRRQTSMRRWPRMEFDAGLLAGLISDHHMVVPQFEREIGMHRGYLDNLARGTITAPWTWAFQRMAVVLDMTMDELFDAVYVERDPRGMDVA